jgi:hypothetical protein
MTFNYSCCSCQVVTVYCFSSLVNHLICKFPVVDVQFAGDVFCFSIKYLHDAEDAQSQTF